MDVVSDSQMEFDRMRNQELRAMKYKEKDLEIIESNLVLRNINIELS